MTIYTGYVTVPITTYDAFRNAVDNNGYDVDPQFGAGCQCWDLASILWWNIGFPQNYPLTGSNHAAYECWTVNRNNNASYNNVTYFDLVYNLSDVKRGDIIVLDATSTNPAGHIALADEDYNGTTTLRCLGQNQGGGTPVPAGGQTANIQNIILTPQNWGAFLGAFRYRAWQQTPPTPTPTSTGNFNFVLYARKLRERRNML